MMALRDPNTGEFLGGQEVRLVLWRGPEGMLHVELGPGRVCVMEELCEGVWV